MKKLALVAALVCAFALPSFAAGKKSTVKIINQSKWEIHHIFLSSTDDESWGPDQLEDAVLGKGESLTINSIPCDLYDVKVVDEDGDECVLADVGLCAGEDVWAITDEDLLGCQAASE